MTKWFLILFVGLISWSGFDFPGLNGKGSADPLGPTGPIISSRGDTFICLNVTPRNFFQSYYINSVENATEYEWIVSGNGFIRSSFTDTSINVNWTSKGIGTVMCIPKNSSEIGDTAKFSLIVSEECINVNLRTYPSQNPSIKLVNVELTGYLDSIEISELNLSWRFDTNRLNFLGGRDLSLLSPSISLNSPSGDTLNLSWQNINPGNGRYIDSSFNLIYQFEFKIKPGLLGDLGRIEPNPMNQIKNKDGVPLDLFSYGGVIYEGFLPFCGMGTDEPPGCLVCGPTYFGNTGTYSPGTPGPTFPCGTIENNFWISVIASDSVMTAAVLAENCVNGQGVQAIFYDWNLDPVSTCFSSGGDNIPGFVEADSLIPGESYWIMIDGFAGDICDVTVTITGNDGSLVMDTIKEMKITSQPVPICSGDIVCLEVDSIPNATQYIWEYGDKVKVTTINQVCLELDTIGEIKISVAPRNYCILGTSIDTTIHITGNIETFLPDWNFCKEQFPVIINGLNFDSAGVFDFVFPSNSDCDSIVYYKINEYPTIQNNMAVNICEGQSYSLPDGEMVDTTGIYTVILENANTNGCDSTIIIDLTVVPSFDTYQSLEACEGEVITLSNGLEITQSGTYTIVLPSSGGCDSTIVYDAIFHPNFTFRDSIQICDGDNYLWQGQLLENEGNYRVDLITANGCDSVIRLNLQHYQAPQIIDTLLIPDDGSGNGSILLQFDGDTTNYTFSWNNGASTMNLMDIPFDSYTLTVGYGDGCFVEFTFEVDRVSSVVGVLSDHGILVYPNPAGEYLNVEFPRNTNQLYKIIISTVDGKAVLNSEFVSNSTLLDISRLSKGRYFLKIFDQSNTLLKSSFEKL